MNNEKLKQEEVTLTAEQQKSAVEAILFSSGDSVEIDRIAQALEITAKETEKLIKTLQTEYEKVHRGIMIVKLDDKYQMTTVEQYGKYIRKVMDMRRATPLSNAAMEVLAVIAYNQPVTRTFVEQVRGVDCSGVIGSLTVKGLLEEKGRLELPGRPLLYGTTENFLRCFNLASLDDLPTLPENEDVIEKQGDQLNLFVKDEENTSQDDTVQGTVEEIVNMATED